MGWSTKPMHDEGPRRKNQRYALLRPDGEVERYFSGKFAGVDSRNEAGRRNRIDQRDTSLRPRPGETAEEAVERVVKAVRDVE